MRFRMGVWGRFVVQGILCSVLVCLVAPRVVAQTSPNERAFPQSKTAIEKALKNMQVSISGRLPALEGFAQPGERPLDRYERGYYQATIEVSSVPSGGSVVRVSLKVTAWYNDPVASRSGYQLLASNGRLEADLLDQLTDRIARAQPENRSPETQFPEKRSPETARGTIPAAVKPSAQSSVTPPAAAEPAISAPAPKFPESDRTFSSSVTEGLAERATAPTPESINADKSTSALRAEAQSLEEILKNQGHPRNLVAVKKSGTPVVGSPTLTAKPLFLASLHDEFEMLDFNADWVHVRISGLSRGWIWRNSLEMPDGIANIAASTASALASAADLFHVIREETAPFPGDWEPLRSKSVKIISVQKTDDSAKDAGPKERLEYAKFLLEKNFTELAPKPQDLAGIVVIFDSADGGMIAATLPTLQQWRAGALSDAALWHKCFFDPPETFDSAGSSASQ